MDGEVIVHAGSLDARHPESHARLYRYLTGEAGWHRLHPAIRRRFSRDATMTGPIVYSGALTIERSWVGGLFASLGRVFGSPLPRNAAQDAPAEVRVYSDGGDGIVWERRLSPRPDRLEIVQSTKRPWTNERLLECARHGLSMLLAVFEDRGSLVFESRGFGLLLGRYWLRIPDFLTPGCCRVTHEGIDDRLFRFTLEINHPRWGRVMTQTGIFVDPEA